MLVKMYEKGLNKPVKVRQRFFDSKLCSPLVSISARNMWVYNGLIAHRNCGAPAARRRGWVDSRVCTHSSARAHDLNTLFYGSCSGILYANDRGNLHRTPNAPEDFHSSRITPGCNLPSRICTSARKIKWKGITTTNVRGVF